MPCYHPLPAALETYGAKPPYKRRMKLNPKGQPTHWLPCGKCLGCRELQQQQLAIRVIHEARWYTDKWFVTLTYDEAHCPTGLIKADMQKFYKRLRRAQPIKFKHLTCGEYGDRTQRPHYHAALMGLVINDLKPWDVENSKSQFIDEIWGMGNVMISPLTDNKIKYVAGYVLKKAGYRRQHYCDEDGVELQPPYRDMSKGLGKQWLEKYAEDLRLGYLQHEGVKYAIPRYYADKIKAQIPTLSHRIETEKSKNWRELTEEDRTRLRVGEKIREIELRKKRARDQI